MQSTESYRKQLSDDVAVDVFKLTTGEPFLFFYFKKEFANVERWDSVVGPWVIALELETKPIGIAGAIKSPKRSISLPYVGADQPLWTTEGGLFFSLRREGVLNPGLFLDQRTNRMTLKKMIQDAKLDGNCLNLFSYTGAFSVLARSCGLHTHSVDVSDTYLQWEKENHLKNFLDLNWATFHKKDVRDFLRRTKDKFSVIILDPPSFSRGEKGPLQVRKDLPLMFARCLELLDDRGIIFVSSNLSRWRPQDFEDELDFLNQRGGHGLNMITGKIPPDLPKDHSLNSLFFHRL